jgi:methyl-accepting chemotaxis protein
MKKVLTLYKKNKIKGEFYEEVDGYLRYSRPLVIKESCMKCHGVPYKDVKKETYNKLLKKYGDYAFNYKPGDYRGMISTKISMKEINNHNKDLFHSAIIFTLILLITLVIYIYTDKILIIKPQSDYEETLIESNSNAIIAINWKGNITTFNKKAEEIFGWKKEEMLGKKNLKKLIPKRFHSAHEKACNNYLKTGKA